jgi:predicted nucleic acid-binding protein
MKVIKHHFNPVTENGLVVLEEVRHAVDEGEASAFAVAVFLKDGTMLVAHDGDAAHALWLVEALRENILDERLRE